MPTVRDVINRAHRLLTGDLAVPDAETAKNALEALQNKLIGLVAAGAFGRLKDELAQVDLTARENRRYLISTSVTVTLPTEIEDDLDDDCDGYRPVLDKAVVVVVDPDAPAVTTSIYDASLGAWITLENLSLNDACPLAQRHMLDLAAILAVEWAPEIIDAKPSVIARAAQGLMNLTQKWDGARRPVEIEAF